MSDREFVLEALESAPAGLSAPNFRVHAFPTEATWTEFAVKLESLGGHMMPHQMLPLIMNRGFWADDDIDLAEGGVRAASVWEAEVGICRAELAIADTGSLVVSAAAGRWRLTSLAPPVNVVLVREADLVGSLQDAVARLPRTTSVMITGTSRTADIEGILVRGVHGPRELYVVVLPA